MREWQGKRYWLVGASEGLGRALAEKMSRAGAEVFVSARSADRLAELVEALPGKAHAVPVDIGDRAAVEAAAQHIGDLDGMVFVAGVYWPQPAQEWNAEEVETMFDVNLTGAARCIGAVLPAMIDKGAGHIVLTGSLSGFRGLPGSIGYGSAKAGLMHLAESMQADLRTSPIEVQLVNPGFIRTRLTDKNDFKMPFIMEPEQAATEMFEHMCGDSFKKNFPMVFSWLFRLSQFLPDFLYYRLFGR